MTLFAEIGTAGFQDLRDIGAMGIMACITLGGDHRFMGIIPGELDLRIGMTGIAHHVHAVLQKALDA
jgi:hypothetical protein